MNFTDDLLEVARATGVVENTVADAFEDAAAAWVPGEDVPFIVRRFAHPDSWASLLERWEEYVERCRLRDGLGTGALSWAEYEPDLRGPSGNRIPDGRRGRRRGTRRNPVRNVSGGTMTYFTEEQVNLLLKPI